MNRNRKRMAALLAAAVLALSGGACSAGGGQGPAAPAHGGSGASGASDADTGEKGSAGTNSAGQHSDPADAGSGEAARQGESGNAGPAAADKAAAGSIREAQTKKLYRMTSAYRFKPIDETAPKNVVLLTFDDGPKDKEVLIKMLDALDKHKAKAIFFVNGYRIKENPDLLRLIDERGQTIGNHAWNHIELNKLSESEVEKQVAGVQRIVKELTGRSPQFFRPPYAAGGDTVKAIARREGLLFMNWSNGSLDWTSSSKNKPDAVISNVLDQLHPGANILMHELPWTAEALDSLLSKLEAKGYGFIDPATIDVKESMSEAAS